MDLNPVPTSVKEAIERIDTISEAERRHLSKAGFAGLHISIGMSLRNAWGLWGENELVDDFRSLGLHHADDMSGYIFDGWKARFNEEAFNPQRTMRRYFKHWKEYDPELAEKINSVWKFEE